MPVHGMRLGGPPGGGLPQMAAASDPAVLTDGMPEMPVAEDVMPIPEPQPASGSGKVSQEVARYLGPEYRCAGCIHFWDATAGQGECEIVEGPIMADGVCSLFEPDVDNMGVAEEPMATDAVPAADEELEVE